MNEVVQVALPLVGGLALFLFGMNTMSESLQKVAGAKMKSILGMLTKNPVLGVLAGALTTAVLQSSSATTVMAIGFVSARLMGLPQAISIILGANIGTTITAQIIAFKLSDWIMAIVFVGFIISFVAKSERLKFIGKSIFGFGVLFLGIDIMGDAMKPLAASPIFMDMISQVTSVPVLGVAVGTLMTVVVQSSSATIAVLQNLASQPGPDGVTSIIGLQGAIPVLLGDNIGTTITAILASIGQSRDSKRVALSHCLFNVSGCLLFIWFIPQFAAFVTMISPAGPEVEVISRQIANAHTSFNVIMTCVWLPLIWLMVKIVSTVLPDKKMDGSDRTIDELADPLFLDRRIIAQPAAALQLVAKEILNCGDIIRAAIADVMGAMDVVGVKDPERSGKPSRNTEKVKLLESARVKGEAAFTVCQKTTEYLSEMFAAGVLTEDQATHAARLMRVLNDEKRIALVCGRIAESLKVSGYSSAAKAGMKQALEVVDEMFVEAMAGIVQGAPKDSSLLLAEKKDAILTLDLEMRKAHMARVAAGECDAALTAPFDRVLDDIDRMSYGCVSIAEAASGHSGFHYYMTDEVLETLQTPAA